MGGVSGGEREIPFGPLANKHGRVKQLVKVTQRGVFGRMEREGI